MQWLQWAASGAQGSRRAGYTLFSPTSSKFWGWGTEMRRAVTGSLPSPHSALLRMGISARAAADLHQLKSNLVPHLVLGGRALWGCERKDPGPMVSGTKGLQRAAGVPELEPSLVHTPVGWLVEPLVAHATGCTNVWGLFTHPSRHEVLRV